MLAPNADDAVLGADMQRNNDFNFASQDPHGYAVPLGSHIRRMNPQRQLVSHFLAAFAPQEAALAEDRRRRVTQLGRSAPE